MGDGGVFILTPSPPTVIFFLNSFTVNRSSLSLSSSVHSNSLAQDLRDSLRDLALESVRKLKKILLLSSCALGEALVAWCVFVTLGVWLLDG